MTPVDGLIAALKAMLRPYQWEWMVAALGWQQDVAILGGRQSGKDFWLELWLVIQLLSTEEEVQVVSASRTHAQDVISNVRRHLDRILPCLGLPRSTPSADSKTEIRMPWGSRIKSHASTPRSIIGHRGSFILNEISALPEAETIWETALPIVSEAKKNGKNAHFIVIGNASYQGSFWHKLWEGLGTKTLHGFRKFFLPASESWIQRGFSAAEIAAAQATAIAQIGLSAFRQWFECQWRSAEGGFFGQQLLDDRRWHDGDIDAHASTWPQVIGLDVGHGGNPSAAVRILLHPDGLSYYALDSVSWQETEYSEQVRRVQELVNQRPTLGIILDATGAKDFAWRLSKEITGARVVPIHFGAQNKWAIFRDLLQGLEQRTLWIPPGDLELRVELDGIERKERESGIPEIILPRQGDTHGDRAVGLALAHAGACGLRVRHAQSAQFVEATDRILSAPPPQRETRRDQRRESRRTR